MNKLETLRGMVANHMKRGNRDIALSVLAAFKVNAVRHLQPFQIDAAIKAFKLLQWKHM